MRKDISTSIAESKQEEQKVLITKGGKQVGDISDLFSSTTTYDTGSIAPKRKTSEYLKSATGWVYGCVNAIADEISNINLHLYRYNGQNVTEIFNHPILDILYRANGFTTKFDLFNLTANYLELAGEAPWFISYQNNRPIQIVLLRPDRLEIVAGKDGEIIAGYKYEVEAGKKIDLEVREVVFLRYPDPNSPFRGAGTLQASAKTVDIDDFSEDYNRNFFYNSARPDLAISTDQKLTDDQVVKLEKKLNNKFKGKDNAHKTIILVGGLKATPINVSAKDMDFLEQQRFSRDKILGIFRTPKTALGLTEDVNRANAEATDYVFAKRTIKPKMQRIVEQLNEFFIPLFPNSDNLYLDFDDPVPEDTTSKLAMYQNGLQNGWLTINEVRAMRGLPDIGEEGDKVRIPNNFIEAGADPFGNIIPAKGLKNKPKQPTPVIASSVKHKYAKNNRTKEQAEEVKKEVAKSLRAIVMLSLKNQNKGKAKTKAKEVEISEEEKPMLELQAKQHNISNEFTPVFKSRIARIFRSQKRIILDQLKSVKNVKKINPDKYLIDIDEAKGLYERGIKNLMASIIIEQSVESFAFIGLDDKLTTGVQAVKDFIKDRVFDLAEETTKETNSKLGATLAEGVGAGESVPQLRKRVSNLFNDMEVYRSERIARSEVIRATNFSAETSYKESGVVKGKRWLTALDSRTCEFCGPLNGKIISLDSNFFDKGDTYRGNQGGVLDLDYTDTSYPPLHVNCRCTIIPIVQRSIDGKMIKELKEKADKVDQLEAENQELAQLNEKVNELLNEK